MRRLGGRALGGPFVNICVGILAMLVWTLIGDYLLLFFSTAQFAVGPWRVAPIPGSIGPVALVAGAIAGAVAGRKSEKKVEVGFSQEKLGKLNDCLAPGGSALVLLIEHRWFHTLQVEMVDFGGQLIHERLSDVSYDDLVKGLETEEKDS